MENNFPEFYKNWSFIHAVINIVFFGISFSTGYYSIWLTISTLSFLYFISFLPFYVTGFPLKIGYANIITLFRLFLLIVLAFYHTDIENLFLFFTFLFLIILDGIDGYIARRFHQTSEMGECLDMETDAFMVLVLSWIHFSEGRLGYWILIPGSLKYFYTVLFYFKEWGNKEFLRKKIRALIAVVFFVSLITPFVFASSISQPICMVASMLIIISFGLSAVLKFLNRITIN